MHDEKCIKICTELAEENPEDYRLYALMGEAALNMREHAAGLESLKLANIIHPKHPFILLRMADAFTNLGKPIRAKKLLNSIRQDFIGTKDAPLWAQTMADACRVNLEYDRAEQLLKFAIQEAPNWSVSWGSLAILEICRHNYGQAVIYFQKQYELNPTWKSAHELGMNLPFVDRHKEAYEFWSMAAEQKWEGQQFLGKKMWHGEFTDSLMIYGDGGLGDTIHYSRYLLECKKYAKRVYFNPQNRHREIVEAMDLPGVEISSTMEWDCATWLMVTPGDTNLPNPNQAPAPTKLNLLHEDLPHPAIAITWSGDFKHANDKLRSMSLDDFRSVIEQFPQVHWFTVSPGEKIAKEIQKSGLPITQYSGTLLEACKKLVSADAYIGVDTGHAHVTATQGIPTHVILKDFVDSRWGSDSDKTPYYSSMRLYRAYRDGLEKSLKDIAGRLHEIDGCQT